MYFKFPTDGNENFVHTIFWKINKRKFSTMFKSVLYTYIFFSISFPGDIDDCIVQPTPQTQFTPLTEALCDVIMELTSQGQSATIEKIKYNLGIRY
jgi:hypothetical protein